MQSDVISAYVNWFISEQIDDLVEVVLKYPPFGKLEIWNKVLEITFRELDQCLLRGKIKRKNESHGCKYIRRLVMIGGDEKCAIPFHAHCLVDRLGVDRTVFKSKLEKAWGNNVRKYIHMYTTRRYHPHLVDIYIDEVEDFGEKYIFYATRFEGEEFKTRPDKICAEATYLPAWKNSDQLTTA